MVVGGRDGSRDGVRRERCEHIGRGDDGRHEPLELHERRAAGARRQRARGHRVHAVPVAGRSPAAGQLHGGGHVPGNADVRQPPVDGRPEKVEDSLRPHVRLGAARPERVRKDLRPPGHGGRAAPAPGRPRPVRRRFRRTVPVRLRVVPGPPVERAARLRHAAAGRRADGTLVYRPRGQPRGRVQPGGRPRDTQDVRAEAEQRGALRVLHRGRGGGERGAQVRRAERVRHGGSGHTVAGVRQQSLRQRTSQARHTVRRQRRRHTPETAQQIAGGK